MNCTCNVAQRRLTPGVFNLKQFLNGSETMKWRLTTHYTDAGQCDLCDYEAFLVICVGGRIDEIKLTKSLIQPEDLDAENILELTWNVGQYATELTGYTKYQIIFRSAKIGQLGVIGAGDAAANGVYTIDSELVDGTYRTWTNHAEESGYKIKWDSTNKRWTIYKADGTTVVDYQTFANPEPCCGTWSTVAVGNNTAAVWTSDEAVMYISETIAADQSVTANFPTILRQVWEYVRSMIIKSGVTVLEGAITESDWQGSAAPYYINVPDKVAGVPAGCTIVGTQLFKTEAGGGFSDIGNTKLVHETDGAIKLYSLQKVTGKAVVFIKGGNGYFVADGTHAIRGSNNIAAFGGIAVGLGNEIKNSGQGAVVIGGGNKNITGIGAIVIGTGNSNVAGNRSVTIGFNAKCNAEQAVAIGTQVKNTADAKGGVFLPGGETRVRILDPLGDGERDFLSCFRHTYKGQSVPETVERTLTGDRTVTPDVNHMSRLVLKGTGTATLVPNYLSDGDRLEIIYNASNITLNYPAAWIGSITAKGVTVVLIEQFLGKVFITTKYHE